MNSLKVLNIVGCRPNFVKIAPLMAEMARYPEISPILVHTGQHYDSTMSDVFFRDLEIPRPDICLGVGSGSYARQIAEIVQRLEEVLLETAPDLVLVVGDVNSTVAAALSAVSLGFPVAHVEAGLRSFDREMPEEINRVLTDSLSDLLFATESSAVANLLREGKDNDQIYLVGNVMIDSLARNSRKIAQSDVLSRFGLSARHFGLVTLHRPSNVDTSQSLREIAAALASLQELVPLIFPVHPRTAARFEEFRAWNDLISLPNLQIVEPLGYIDFMKLMKESVLVLTDSGGVQEESTALGVPCLTLRENTERPITLTEGTNQLVGTSSEKILASGLKVLRGGVHRARCPENWDGHAAERIVSILLEQRDHIKHLYRSVRERKLCSDILSPVSQLQA